MLFVYFGIDCLFSCFKVIFFALFAGKLIRFDDLLAIRFRVAAFEGGQFGRDDFVKIIGSNHIDEFVFEVGRLPVVILGVFPGPCRPFSGVGVDVIALLKVPFLYLNFIFPPSVNVLPAKNDVSCVAVVISH